MDLDHLLTIKIKKSKFFFFFLLLDNFQQSALIQLSKRDLSGLWHP